jgi:hypothetical protein
MRGTAIRLQHLQQKQIATKQNGEEACQLYIRSQQETTGYLSSSAFIAPKCSMARLKMGGTVLNSSVKVFCGNCGVTRMDGWAASRVEAAR